MSTRPLDAVCFDYWNTLVHEDGTMVHGRREAWAAVLGDAGRAVADHELDMAFEGAWRRFTDAWEANVQYTSVDAARDLLADVGLDDPDGTVHARLIEDLDRVARSAALELTPNVEVALRALKEAGVGLAIICDVGMTPSPVLRHHLERHGVLELFDHWSFSDEVGWYKPAPAIFRHALDGLGGVEPSRAAHVGDLRRTDVAGARAAGMRSVRYHGVADDTSDGPEADVVCGDHAALPALLGF